MYQKLEKPEPLIKRSSSSDRPNYNVGGILLLFFGIVILLGFGVFTFLYWNETFTSLTSTTGNQPTPKGCCPEGQFWPHGKNPGDACDPDPRCGSPFANYILVGLKLCCEEGSAKQIDRNRCFRFILDIFQLLKHLGDQCGQCSLCSASCIDTVSGFTHDTEPTAQPGDPDWVTNYLDAWKMGYNFTKGGTSAACMNSCSKAFPQCDQDSVLPTFFKAVQEEGHKFGMFYFDSVEALIEWFHEVEDEMQKFLDRTKSVVMKDWDSIKGKMFHK